MSRYRHQLPQLDHRLFLTDGGPETTLIFHEGLELPDFAAFHLLKTPDGEAAVDKYFRTYADLAKRFKAGLILESATWRASADWGARLGYSAESLADANRKAINLLVKLRGEYQSDATPIVISGCVGPRGDGYVPDQTMSAADAEHYHMGQLKTFAASPADMVCATTMNYVEEAIGITQGARRVEMPVAVSFTVETDGNLATGQKLKDAIEQIDEVTGNYPSYFMINCAHPTHFENVIGEAGPWLERIRGVRANASQRSHAELNESAELDSGDPVELGRQYAALTKRLPGLSVMGGCCGTDDRHVEQMAINCSSLF